MEQRQRSQNHSHRLHSAAQQFIEQLAVFTGNGYSDWAARHTPRIAETFYNANVFIEPLQVVRDLEYVDAQRDRHYHRDEAGRRDVNQKVRA
jgi:hypothetical protein